MANANYIRVQGGTTFTLTVEPLSLSLNNNIIRLACDTSTGAITILLPKISKLGNNIELNVYIDDISNNASANNISVVVPIGNTIENASSYVMNTDGAKAQVYVSSFTKYGVVTGGASGGGETHLIAKTYAELLALSGSSSLIQGQHYLLTDFQTNSIIPNTSDFTLGANEPLILVALNSNTLSEEALSTIYQKDIVRYTLTNINGGTKGTILYRKNTENELATYYDWRVVKFRRWENPTIAGLYNAITNNGNGFIDYFTFTDINSKKTEIPLKNNGSRLNNIVFLNECDNNTFGQGIYETSTFVGNCKNNRIFCATFFANTFNVFENNFINCNKFSRNEIYSVGEPVQFINNNINCEQFDKNINAYFGYNTISCGGFNLNKANLNVEGIDNSFNQNTIFCGGFINNFYSMISENTITCGGFANNTIYEMRYNGIHARFFASNTIGFVFVHNFFIDSCDLFQNNGTIGDSFAYNEINASIQNCTNINQNFKNNIINTELIGLDLSSPTEFYVIPPFGITYTKTVFKNQAGSVFMTYLDGTNTPAYVSVP